MNAQHTPGPWWTTDRGIRDSGGYIAHTNSVQHYAEQDERYALEVAQREADKRLIAAAPDLLEALQALVGWEEAESEHFGAEGPDDWLMQKARAAIAKVKGGAA